MNTPKGRRGGAVTSKASMLATSSKTQVSSSYMYTSSEAESDDDSDVEEQTPKSKKRTHSRAYHVPLLLTSSVVRNALLDWYASVSTKRAMPWRKEWLDPSTFEDQEQLREALKRRAYGVWISEIMLQQTRVETVIPYYTTWLTKWPTIEALAAASSDQVLACWKGLGYYSRATRLQEAAKDVVADPELRGLLPATPQELVHKVQGVGPYTAGAIAAIAFGVAAPMVDGNVVRVLSRQIGLYASPKVSSTNALITCVAEFLVRSVAASNDGNSDGEDASFKDIKRSARPGAWGQSLMELGATICKPKPDCGECPISSTCRAYAEGEALAISAGALKKASNAPNPEQDEVEDIEDLCTLCEPLEELLDVQAKTRGNAAAKSKAAAKAKADAKQPKLSFGAVPLQKSTPKGPSTSTSASTNGNGAKARAAQAKPSEAALEIIVAYASRYPMKVVKAAVREEACAVCVIRDVDGKVLIAQRPDKGLLASLWEFPALTVPSGGAEKQYVASKYATSLLPGSLPRYETYHGSIVHLFSHIRLTMHVHSFSLPRGTAAAVVGERHKWIASDEVDGQSLSTGNVRCWELITGKGQSKKGDQKKRKR